MKNKLFKMLAFLRIVDEKGQLSITNIMVMTFAIKFAMVPMESASIQDMAMALSAMGIYMGKKAVTAYTETKTQQLPDDLMEKIHNME